MATKKAPKKPAKKSVAEKSTTKKAASKKSTSKKAATKKTASKKTAAKKSSAGRKYGKAASKSVEREVKAMEQGKLKSGSGKKVTSRKQAIAIGLSEARKAGAKVPKKKS
jgi:hypothetical protein